MIRHGLSLVCVLLLGGCGQKGELARSPASTDTVAAPAPAPSEDLAVGLALKDDGRTVQLAPGQVVMVSLKANHTTGYQWVLADSAHAVLAREGDPTYDVDSTGAVGAGGFETWRFRAVQAGTGTIALQYRRLWEPRKPPETTVRYTVEVR